MSKFLFLVFYSRHSICTWKRNKYPCELQANIHLHVYACHANNIDFEWKAASVITDSLQKKNKLFIPISWVNVNAQFRVAYANFVTYYIFNLTIRGHITIRVTKNNFFLVFSFNHVFFYYTIYYCNVLWRFSKLYWITTERWLFPYVFQINFYKYLFYLSPFLQLVRWKKMSTIVLTNSSYFVVFSF